MNESEKNAHLYFNKILNYVGVRRYNSFDNTSSLLLGRSGVIPENSWSAKN